MIIHFHIHYIPNPGEVIMIYGSAPETGWFQEERALEMQHRGDGYWHLPVEFRGSNFLEYRYFVRSNGQTKRREWGENHRVGLPSNTDLCTLYDHWQAESDMSFLYTSAYTKSLLAIDHSDQKTEYSPDHVLLKVQAPFVRKGQSIGITGDIELLGKWNEEHALKMQSERFPEWSISLNAKNLPESFNYKFVVLDNATNKMVSREWGEPRSLFTPRCMDRQMLMHSGMIFRFQEAPWKGAGVAIPVFSLQSEDSWGCGDFDDLKKMTDWAALTGQQLIQILPINDTTLVETWQDSIPYNIVSAFALHPMYLSIKELPLLKDSKIKRQFEAERLVLNALPVVDHEKVNHLKWRYFHCLFEQEGTAIFETEAYKSFFEKNHYWLVPYAAFCYLRQKQESYDFRSWGEYSNYNASTIYDLSRPEKAWFMDIAIHYYIQFQLHLQLSAARDYAHANSVVLKGDLPIGMSRFSADIWVQPHLFNIDAQIGAPPDVFTDKGQNWAFPSYNRDRMKAENFEWWKNRLRKMADYFDVYRIDHILGFFRLWEIPSLSKDGLLGHFSPALPLSIGEMKDMGFDFEVETMTKPFITNALLERLFGKASEKVKSIYLLKKENERFQLKPDFETQQKINSYFSEKKKEVKIREGLLELCNEVLFVEDTKTPNIFYPRISGNQTACYKSLNLNQKSSFDRLYSDFFQGRHVDFWKNKALEILPALMSSTNMLACGEDLGMTPSCVPDVMHTLGILSLEIQRMPKTFGTLFENLNAIPYQSVCTPSTHDMNPIRAWWMEDSAKTQQYYQQVLWKKGNAPENCTPEMAEQIIRIHLESPALWVVFLWQDWMSMDEKLRLPEAKAERINDPANPNQNWNYRMHLTLEALLNEKDFNEKVKAFIKRSDR